MNARVIVAKLRKGAVALLFLSAIGVSYCFVQDRSDQEVEKTELRLLAIEDALGKFIGLHGRLPCPARSSVSFEDPDFGVENCKADRTFKLLTPYAKDTVSDYIVKGAVPVKTLNLSNKYSLDAWDNRIDYIISLGFGPYDVEDALENPTYDGSVVKEKAYDSFLRSSKGILKIVDSDMRQITNEAVMLLVSHGKNGFGAYKKNGKARIPTQNATCDERINDLNTEEMGIAEMFTTGSNNPCFDDIIHYKLKYQLVYDAKQYSHENKQVAQHRPSGVLLK